MPCHAVPCRVIAEQQPNETTQTTHVQACVLNSMKGESAQPPTKSLTPEPERRTNAQQRAHHALLLRAQIHAHAKEKPNTYTFGKVRLTTIYKNTHMYKDRPAYCNTVVPAFDHPDLVSVRFRQRSQGFESLNQDLVVVDVNPQTLVMHDVIGYC